MGLLLHRVALNTLNMILWILCFHKKCIRGCLLSLRTVLGRRWNHSGIKLANLCMYLLYCPGRRQILMFLETKNNSFSKSVVEMALTKAPTSSTFFPKRKIFMWIFFLKTVLHDWSGIISKKTIFFSYLLHLALYLLNLCSFGSQSIYGFQWKELIKINNKHNCNIYNRRMSPYICRTDENNGSTPESNSVYCDTWRDKVREKGSLIKFFFHSLPGWLLANNNWSCNTLWWRDKSPIL